MGVEISFEKMADFQGLVTLTFTLNQVILNTVMHHSSTFTYIPNVIQIEETVCGRTGVRTGERTFETHFIRSTQRSRPKNEATLVAVAGSKRSYRFGTFSPTAVQI